MARRTLFSTHKHQSINPMRRKKSIIIILSILFILIITTAGIAYNYYNQFFKPGLHPNAPEYLYIPTGTTYTELIHLIEKQQILENADAFQTLAKHKKLADHIHPGRYKLDSLMSNNDLINKIRSGNQEPVHLIFNNIRNKEQLAQKIASQLEVDSLSLLTLLNNNNFLSHYGFTSENILSMFIPNTYQLYWNTSDTAFFKRMFKEHQNFWTKQRLQKAEAIDLSPIEISILAAIVEEENHKTDEQPRIAGVYINRLKRGMLLQADPTIKYALNNPGIKRILLSDLEIDSPYNTYKNTGLPPGPIRIPEASTIDAVLNFEKHKYLYMCAKDDFSGYHNFAVSPHQHAINARKYHQALRRNKIKR